MGGKTRLQMRTDLATDLKITIGTEITAAELNRSIERAISDFSRFLPREKTYEESLQFTVTGESVTMPKDTDTDGVVADEDLNAVDDGSAVGIDGQPDVPRPLTITLTDANNTITGMTVTAYGTDKDEIAVEETWHWLRGDSKTIPGKKYFKNVYMVYVNQIDGAGPGDVLDIGWGVYTDVWVYLAYKPIKWGSEKSATDVDDNAIVRNTDFYLDYFNGRIKAVSGGDIIASDTVTISYTKGQMWVDLTALSDFIRVDRVEYPVGDIPQQFVQHELWGNILTVTSDIDHEDQGSMAEDKHVRVYYAAEHQPPSDFAPGSIPDFIENTVLLAASAYALFTYSLKQEHQAATDLTTARTAVGYANTDHVLLATALTNVKKYLDNNSGIEAATILYHIETDVGELRTKMWTALDAINTYLDVIGAATTGDLAKADLVRANYMGTTNYVDGGTEPDIKTYLESGDAILNTNAIGGEGTTVPAAYSQFAQVVKNALVASHEQDRSFYLEGARARTNAALGYAQEAAQRLSTIRSYIEQSGGYTAISNTFAREAEARITKINAYLAQASGYTESAAAQIALADRLKADAITRREEAWTIWRDRKQYIGDFVQSARRQGARYD